MACSAITYTRYIVDDEGSDGLMACSAITHTSDANSDGTESSQSHQVKRKLNRFSSALQEIQLNIGSLQICLQSFLVSTY